MTDTFANKLSIICTEELLEAKDDLERIGEMMERLAHALSWTIVVSSDFDSKKIQYILTGIEQYLYEDSVALSN